MTRINNLIAKGGLQRRLEGKLLFSWEDFCRINFIAGMMVTAKLYAVEEETNKRRRSLLNKDEPLPNDKYVAVIRQVPAVNSKYFNQALKIITKIMRISPIQLQTMEKEYIGNNASNELYIQKMVKDIYFNVMNKVVECVISEELAMQTLELVEVYVDEAIALKMKLYDTPSDDTRNLPKWWPGYN